MAYRFVHAADIHLDSPLKSLALRDPELASLVGDATRQAFARIVDLCLAERVDALMLAGDLYDGDQTSMRTARFLAEQLRRLDAAGIRTFVIRGNHDALSKIPLELTLPPTVRLFGGRADIEPVGEVDGGLDIRVHGLSFSQPKAPDSLLPKYRAPVEGAVNIGLMHTSLGGTPPHDDYAPCGLADLQGSGFSYWALGHIHLRGAPEARGRAAAVVMPGIPQGRDIGESGPKSVTLVTVRDDRSILVEERPTSVAQFETVGVDLGGVEDWAGTVDRIATALALARSAAASPHLVARLSLTGATPFAWQIRRDPERLRAEAELRAGDLGATWIEKIAVQVSAPAAAAPAVGDAVSELGDIIGASVLGSESLRAGMAGLVEELKRKLPRACWDAVLGPDEASSAAILARLFAEGAEDVLARLREPAGAGPA